MYFTLSFIATHIKVISLIPKAVHIHFSIEYTLVMVSTHEIAFWKPIQIVRNFLNKISSKIKYIYLYTWLLGQANHFPW